MNDCCLFALLSGEISCFVSIFFQAPSFDNGVLKNYLVTVVGKKNKKNNHIAQYCTEMFVFLVHLPLFCTGSLYKYCNSAIDTILQAEATAARGVLLASCQMTETKTCEPPRVGFVRLVFFEFILEIIKYARTHQCQPHFY